MKQSILLALLACGLAFTLTRADDHRAEVIGDSWVAIYIGHDDRDDDRDNDHASQGIPLIEFEDTGVLTRIHPAKLTIGKDRKLYFNSSAAIVYWIDEDGVLEEVSILPNAGGIPDDDFTIGITFDTRGDLYVSNVTGIYMMRAQDLQPDSLPQPVPHTKIGDLPAGLMQPMGLVADKRGNLYQADWQGGAIYKIDIATGNGILWFSDPALLAPMVLPSNNLFGIGFGIMDMAIDTQGNCLYFGTQETHRIYRLRINPDGSPGHLDELAHVPNLAFNGISFDMVDNKVYVAAPWENFQNGIQVTTEHVEVAGSIWVIDLDELDEAGVADPVELIRDVTLGVAVDVVSGSGFGSDEDNAQRLYISDSSLDTFFWPNGDPSVAPLPDMIPEPGVPFPLRAYHAAIRVVELDD